MNIGVITTLNKKLYKQYGHRFFETYNWPFDLIVYSEDMLDIPNSNIVVRSIFDEVPSCEEFVNRNKDKQELSSFETKDKEMKFKTDGVRFCYKVYAYTDQIINNEDYDAIIGIDADSVFYKSIDVDWIKNNIHKDDCMLTYLGRGVNQYPECGFLYFNMKHKETKNYAKEMKRIYDTDEIYKLQEQHDSFIWNHVKNKFEKEFNVKNYDIGDGKSGHVQARSILGEVYDHTKGPRKLKGRSEEARVK